VNHRNIKDQDIARFFSPKSMNLEELHNEQAFDLKGLVGRIKSSSYCPKEGEEFENLMERILKLFKKHQVNNTIYFTYETKIYWC